MGINGIGHNTLGVYDLERMLYGSTTDSRSCRQRNLRRILRDLGHGVGSGRRYEWTRDEIERLLPKIRTKVSNREVLAL